MGDSLFAEVDKKSRAEVVELVDTQRSERCERKLIRVQISSSAQRKNIFPDIFCGGFIFRNNSFLLITKNSTKTNQSCEHTSSRVLFETRSIEVVQRKSKEYADE